MDLQRWIAMTKSVEQREALSVRSPGLRWSELQRDWARLETAKALGETVLDHASASGTAFAWELQLLNQKSGST
jgi:hypothetical protein